MTLDAIFTAASNLPEDQRIVLICRLEETLPPEDVILSADDPGFLEELDRRFNDSSELIPWSDVRAKE
jgi:hypothetical protein